MKKLIGISKDQEKYIIDSLTRMARPDSSKVPNPYSRKRGRPVGGKNAPGHGAGRKPTKKPARGQQQLTFAGAIEYESVGNANDTVPSSFSTHQLTAVAQAATAMEKAAQEEEEYRAAISGLETFVASVPNGSFEVNIPAIDDDKDGLEFDYDSDESGDDEDDGGSGSHGGVNSLNTNKTKKQRCYKPKVGSAIHTYMDNIITKVKNRHVTINFGTCWIPPPNPLCESLGRVAKPDKFYLSKTWVYVFEPERQCGRLMPKKLPCPRCLGNNTKYKKIRLTISLCIFLLFLLPISIMALQVKLPTHPHLHGLNSNLC